MDYKKEIVEAAIEGLIEGGMDSETATLFTNLLESVYNAGYNEAIRNSIGIT